MVNKTCQALYFALACQWEKIALTEKLVKNIFSSSLMAIEDSNMNKCCQGMFGGRRLHQRLDGGPEFFERDGLGEEGRSADEKSLGAVARIVVAR